MRARRRGRTRLFPRDVEAFGDAALRFSAPDAGAATALAAAVRAECPPGVTDAAGGSDSVLVAFDPAVTTFAAVADGLRSVSAVRGRSQGATHTISVSFDGPDIEQVARLAGVGPVEVRRSLLGCTLQVAFLGFAPGFAYLDGLPAPLDRLPRRGTPRPVVPAGSLALGGGRAAIYPRATPGGWHIVGRTAVTLFDPDRPPYALLAPGDLVRLREVAPEEVGPPPEPAPTRRVVGPAVFTVDAPGLYSVFQDRGRSGLAHLGVSGSGAADVVSLLLANALLGNGPDAACLEVTGTGPALVCRRSTFVAVVGGAPEVLLDRRPVAPGRVIPVEPGQRLEIGSTGWSMRSYLAVRGGFGVPAMLGSRSTDRLGGLGPAPLRQGDELPVGPGASSMADHLVPGAPGQDPPGDPVTVRVLPVGADRPWRRRLFDRPFEVDPASDRVGLRLHRVGDPLDADLDEVPSSAVSAGVVQVPPSGQPVVLSADHATHGGYPVGAVVISADLPVLGRCRPGERVQLVAVAPEEALEELLAQRRAVAAGTAGRYPTVVG